MCYFCVARTPRDASWWEPQQTHTNKAIESAGRQKTSGGFRFSCSINFCVFNFSTDKGNCVAHQATNLLQNECERQEGSKAGGR